MSSRFGTRLGRAKDLAARGGIVKVDGAWYVPSESSELVYKVTSDETGIHCTCEDHARNQNCCKHILAASIVAEQEQAVA